MSEKDKNLPVPQPETHLAEQKNDIVERAERVTALDDGASRQSESRRVRSGERTVYLLMGVLIASLVLVGIWVLLFKKSDGGTVGGDKPPASSSTTQPATQYSTLVEVNVEETQNDVTLRVVSADLRSRYTTLEISVTNHGFEPVSFLGMADSQLVDEYGHVIQADYTAAGSFVTINPNSTVTAKLRYEGPVREDVEHLTLVVNNVGTLKEKWYYELPFPVKR